MGKVYERIPFSDLKLGRVYLLGLFKKGEKFMKELDKVKVLGFSRGGKEVLVGVDSNRFFVSEKDGCFFVEE